ncbi:septum formation initiator [bacterium]|nr:septum formation initiator [bacterium]
MRDLVAPGALGLLILYFCYHAVSGEQGLVRWAELQKDEEALEAELARLEIARDQLSGSLSRLRPDTLDLDYVEDLARTKLSFARPDEVLLAIK